jgi:AraC family transcriptional regulator of adaptative response / DNA-3-methyladenine glycosylase II
MELDRQACDRARKARDARFDGRFFIGVTSTRVYCRPICPARSPRDENVRYFPSAAAAAAAGFRPCLRCRPEAAPGTPAWQGTSGIVSRALRLIGDGALDGGGVDRLADRLGVTARHLRRLFVRHLGAAPLVVARTRRIHSAKNLLDETTLPMHDVAAAAGFGSVRRFNTEMKRTYHRTPAELRRLARRPGANAPGAYCFHLSYRTPYDWAFVLEFLRRRATPGVEQVEGGGYTRTIGERGRSGQLRIAPCANRDALQLDVSFPDPLALLSIVERVRRICDLNGDPAAIHASFDSDPLLSPALHACPGIRVPGAWDGFEVAVRAVLGQQVSVRAATTVAGRVAALFGTPIAAAPGLSRLFPSADILCDAPLERAGVMRSRAATIRALARAVVEGRVRLGPADSPDAAMAALAGIAGIGDWTRAYIAMRAFNEPDAFLSGDLILRRVAGGLSRTALEQRSEAWRPWRAYAVMLLWQSAADAASLTTRKDHGHAPTAARPRVRTAYGGSRLDAVVGE